MRALGCVLALVAAAAPARADTPDAYPWLSAPAASNLESRVEPPAGFRRLPAAKGSFAAWLRELPVKLGRPPVHLFDGRIKNNQEAHHLVLDIDVGARDRQQCADAVMRLRAEYLRASGQDDTVCFRFTNGSSARWSEWRAGARARQVGGKTLWSKTAAPDRSYASFRRYLDLVFAYAGSHSLARELVRVDDPRRIEAGDVFIQGGFPGHAVIVLDVAEDEAGVRAVLLGQSYMPAQEIHVLRGPLAQAWYPIRGDDPVATPEWDFPAGALRRFSATGCPRTR
jgi:hypothetical protein